MKTRHLKLAVFLASTVAGLLGCERRGTEESYTPEGSPPPPPSAPAVSSTPASEAEKEEYRAKTEAKLTETDRALDDLKEQSRTAQGDMKRSLDASITRLQGQRQELQRNLENLLSASARNWERLKGRLEGSLNDLESSVEKVRSSLESLPSKVR
jgi:chromosome segregation ATPase